MRELPNGDLFEPRGKITSCPEGYYLHGRVCRYKLPACTYRHSILHPCGCKQIDYCDKLEKSVIGIDCKRCTKEG